MPVALVVQHLAPEGPARLADALTDAGVTVVVHRADLDGPPPTLDGYDALVVMGGPMSAADTGTFPTRADELSLLRRAIDDGLPTIGICLGAQLLARAAGGDVVPGEHGPEIGWGTVHLEPAAADDGIVAGLASPLPVLHWHGDTFTLPPGSVHLASSARYPNQAFRVGAAAWGLQFHPEVDEESVERFVAAFPHDAALAPGGAGAIRDRLRDQVAALAVWRPALDRFAALAVARSVG